MLNTQYEMGSVAEKELNRTDRGYSRAFVQAKQSTEGYKARVVIENIEYGVGRTEKVIRSNITVPMAKHYVKNL